MFFFKIPVFNLLLFLKNFAGRNNTGKLCAFFRGSRFKRRFRILNFKHFFWNVFAIILRKEYDPYRNSFIFLICYQNGILSYILPVVYLAVRSKIYIGTSTSFFIGDFTLLKFISEGTYLNSVEFIPYQGSKLARSSGLFSLLIRHFDNITLIRMPSKKYYLLDNNCLAGIGVLENTFANFVEYYKAGQKRNLGYKVSVRGVAKNPIDHPHGGGEGRTSGGRPSVTKSSLPAKNVKTRKNDLKKIYSFSLVTTRLHF